MRGQRALQVQVGSRAPRLRPSIPLPRVGPTPLNTRTRCRYIRTAVGRPYLDSGRVPHSRYTLQYCKYICITITRGPRGAVSQAVRAAARLGLGLARTAADSRRIQRNCVPERGEGTRRSNRSTLLQTSQSPVTALTLKKSRPESRSLASSVPVAVRTAHSPPHKISGVRMRSLAHSKMSGRVHNHAWRPSRRPSPPFATTVAATA